MYSYYISHPSRVWRIDYSFSPTNTYIMVDLMNKFDVVGVGILQKQDMGREGTNQTSDV